MTKRAPRINPKGAAFTAKLLNGAVANTGVSMESELEETLNKITADVWDELHSLYQTCLGLLMSSAGVLTPLNNPKIMQNVDNHTRLAELIDLIRTDAERSGNELNKIFAMHSSRRGGAKASELTEAFQIGELYNRFMHQYNATVSTSVVELASITHRAELKLQEAERAGSDRQAVNIQIDPNDPTPKQTVEAVMEQFKPTRQE